MDAKLYKKLSERQEKGTLRSLSSFEGFTDFFSNDYLGCTRRLTSEMSMAGSTGSRLLSGNSELHEILETKFAAFYRSEAALHFNSGYDANLGIFSTLPQKGDTIIYDSLIHASARDGMRLSWAKSYAFRHNDLKHLEQRLQKAEGAIYVAVEALYSMDGDVAPLEEIARLCERYNAYLIVDEAHSGGVFGESGEGLTGAMRLETSVFMRVMTFGKAYGSHGALVLCDQDTQHFLINFCRSFIYSTALPAATLRHNYETASSSTLQSLRVDLQAVLKRYCSALFEAGLTTISSEDSPIQIIEVGDVEKVRRIANQLQTERIAVKPIYAPTVPEGQERLRICLHAYNTKEEIDRLVSLIKSMM